MRRYWGTNHIIAQFIRFMIVGGTGYLLYLALFYLLLGIHLSQFWAVTIAPIANIVWNFILHRDWTFRSRDEATQKTGV